MVEQDTNKELIKSIQDLRALIDILVKEKLFPPKEEKPTIGTNTKFSFTLMELILSIMGLLGFVSVIVAFLVSNSNTRSTVNALLISTDSINVKLDRAVNRLDQQAKIFEIMLEKDSALNANYEKRKKIGL